MLIRPVRSVFVALLIFAGAFLAGLVVQSGLQPAAAGAPVMSPAVHHTAIPVDCISTPTFTSSYTKIADFGTFTVVNANSVVEATFYGRIGVDTLAGANGAIFELRVDDLPAPIGRARAIIRSDEVPGPSGVPATMSGVFDNLTPGDHTASLWVRAGGTVNSGTGGRVDPGCWSSDQILVREYVAFGATYMPIITE